MKKTCNDCRALEFATIKGTGYICGLGYNMGRQKGVPQEPCPKPKTIQSLINSPKKG